MEIREQSRTVELWLTREEKNDPAFREGLKPLYQKYKEQNYLVAVYLPGSGELSLETRYLLLYNRRQLAEQAVRQENHSAPENFSCPMKGPSM